MIDNELKQILSQIIDNQFNLNKKMEEILTTLTALTNTIIKYDEQYQEEIARQV